MLAEKSKTQLSEIHDDRRLLLDLLWTYNRAIAQILEESNSDDEARDNLYSYFWLLERRDDFSEDPIHSLEWDVSRQCIRVAKTIISKRSQRLTKFNLIGLLRRLAKPATSSETLNQVEPGFLIELERLWAGCRGRSGIYLGQRVPEFTHLEGREAAKARSADLDRMSKVVQKGIKKYPSGLDETVIKVRAENKKRIKAALNATEDQWNNWHWQTRNVVRTADDLARLVEISPRERKAITGSLKNRIPFGITPYYVHLMDREPDTGRDQVIRYQVIPPIEYMQIMSGVRRKHEKSFDFMLERDTSPLDLITRRYPMICILKPYNTCAQICVYCQRNWEIETCLDPKAMASAEQLDSALKYIADHPALCEVLVTGGDPLIMSDERLKFIMDRLAAIPHVERIRIGTRTPVVLPMRITDKLADILASYRVLGHRDVCIVTHYEHPYEITPESAQAVDKFRKRGLSVYNQVVYTFANSRRFELVALRRALGLIGVEAYYTFSPKGKEETEWYRVPIARIQQERKEEARLAPGTWRTDDTVFNVPRLGKNYLNRQQDHEVISILPNGKRVYEFHPWEKKLSLVNTYLHTDVSINEYLGRLEEAGEDPADYSTIWYYF